MPGVNITDHSDDIRDAFNDAVERALMAVGMTAEAYAKLELSTPKVHADGSVRPNVDTGRLRNSITYATHTGHDKGQPPAAPDDYEPRGTPEDGELYVGTNVEYAPYVELGTSRQKMAYPYLRPAIENHLDEYKKIIESELKKG